MTPARFLCTMVLVLSWVSFAQAHHSFSIYDIRNKIELKGTLRELNFKSPHITMVLETAQPDGTQVLWTIESLNPRRWDAVGHPRDFARPGETLTILGWAARDGSTALLLSTIITDRGTHVLIDEVRQRSARAAAGQLP